MCQAKTPWEEVVEFHGHSCGGLEIGFKAAQLAMERLGARRDVDEDLLLIVENDSCAVDAFQVLTGCTFGKGNLIFRDLGKHVFTLGRRSDGMAVRLALNPDIPKNQRRDTSAEALFVISEIPLELPEKAQIFETLKCANCGEGVMEARARIRKGQIFCIPCSGEYQR